ncbi:MAG: hypothetical protein R3F29_12960 [Planctomycetota bacterium]
MIQNQDSAPQKGALSRIAAVLALASLGGCCIGDNHPGGMLYLRGGVGATQYEVDGGVDLDTDSYNAEFAVEGQGRVVGGGVRVSAFKSDDELAGPSSDTELLSTSLFPHLTFRPGAGIFRLPIRIGPEVRWHQLDSSGTDVDSYAVGGAVEVAPELDLFRTQRAALSLYGRGHAGAAVAAVSTPLDDYGTTATLLGAEAGVRLQLSKFLLAAGYVWQSTIYDETDPENNITLPETTYTNDGIFLSVGVRF